MQEKKSGKVASASLGKNRQESMRIYVNNSTNHTQLLRIAASYGIKEVENPSPGDFNFLYEPTREEINEVTEVIKGGGVCLMSITNQQVLSDFKIKTAESRGEMFSILPADFIPNEIEKIEAQGVKVTEAPPEWISLRGNNQKYFLYRPFGIGHLYLTTADLFSDRYISSCGNFRLFSRIISRYAPEREIPNNAIRVIPGDLCVYFDLMDEGYKLDEEFDICIIADNIEKWREMLEKVKEGKGAIFTHSPNLVEKVNEVLADYGIEVSKKRVEGGWRNLKHPLGKSLTLDTYLWGPHIIYGGKPILLSRDCSEAVTVSFSVGRGVVVLIPDYTALGLRYSMARELIVKCIKWIGENIT
ncbi:MAG: hypothetical protein KAX20_00325 [Candidatus Omnitrophica bacterium]|nr:hypothetical protein [Candidatus Omnitrophota bacterium]